MVLVTTGAVLFISLMAYGAVFALCDEHPDKSERLGELCETLGDYRAYLLVLVPPVAVLGAGLLRRKAAFWAVTGLAVAIGVAVFALAVAAE